MNNKNKRILGVITLVVLGILIASTYVTIHPTGITGYAVKEPAKPIKVGYVPLSFSLPFFIALENRYFEEEGVIIEPVKCADANVLLDSLISGRVDVHAGGGFTALYSVEANSPGQLKVFLPSGEDENNYVANIIVKNDSSISSLEDLKGKKIGTYTGIAMVKSLRLFLQKYFNLTPDEVDENFRIIQVGTDLQSQALATGQFDALFTGEPYSTITLEKTGGRVLMANPRARFLMNPYPANANAFSTRFLKENPVAARRVYRAMVRAVKFIDENEVDAKKILSKYTPLDEDIALKSRLYKWWTLKELNEPEIENLDPISESTIQEYADLLYQTDELPKRINVSNTILREEDFVQK